MALQLCYCWMRLLQILFNTEEQIGNTRLKEKACPTVYIQLFPRWSPKDGLLGILIVGWSDTYLMCCKSHQSLSERIFHSCQIFFPSFPILILVRYGGLFYFSKCGTKRSIFNSSEWNNPKNKIHTFVTSCYTLIISHYCERVYFVGGQGRESSNTLNKVYNLVSCNYLS